MIIGLGYRARSGKDTLGEYLEKELNFKRTAYAYPLKEATKLITGWGDEHVYGDLKEVEDEFWGMTPRKFMQLFGTDACRNNVHEQIWVKALQRQILKDPKADWVITDVRFPNEAQIIQSFGGYVVRIDRDNPDDIAAGASAHKSETSMDNFDNWDYVIDNNGTFVGLYDKAHDMVEYFRGKQ